MRYYLVVREDSYSKELAEKIRKNVVLEYDEKNPDIVVAVGGDGTILSASHLYPKSIVFGLHTGHLGFFANYNPDTLNLLIEDLNKGTYKTEEISLLSCTFEGINGYKREELALNEITAISSTHTLIMDVMIDEEKLETFRGTGLCISTTSGSTAYNKSLHGGVVDHELTVMQLAEIASINSNAYRTLSSSLVLSDKRVITLETLTPQDLCITVDHLAFPIEGFTKLTAAYKGDKLKMAFHSKEEFIKRISRTFIMTEE